MNDRMWKEFGKMWDNMEAEGIEFSLVCYPTPEDEEYVSPYKALKDVYFEKYLGMNDYTDLELELDDETLKLLYKTADIQHITIDELVINILKDFIDKKEIIEKSYEEGVCCMHCIHCKDAKNLACFASCDVTGKVVNRSFVCDYFQRN